MYEAAKTQISDADVLCRADCFSRNPITEGYFFLSCFDNETPEYAGIAVFGKF
jgi:hypothetical protein